MLDAETGALPRGPTARPAAAAVVGGGAAVMGLLLTRHTHPYVWWVWLPVQLVGLSFTAAGVVAWLRRPANRTGRLMTAVGISWYIGDLQITAHPLLFALGFCLFYLSPVIFAHMVLALPTGRLTARSERLVVAAMYASALITQTLRYFNESQRPAQGWGTPSAALSIWAPVGSVVALTLTLAAIGLLVRRWCAAGRPARRTHALVWTTGAAIGMVVLATILASLVKAPPSVQQELLFAFALGLVLTPFAILAGLLRVRMARMRVADLVMRLDRTPQPPHLRAALADALGDPTVQVYFRLPPGPDYVDVDGRRVGVPPADGRAVTLVERQGEQLAVLVHDPALIDQRPLVDAVLAAARLALENAHLHAAQRAQLEEVRASRARIVAAADAERHRIQRDLHDGAQHTLLAISILVGRAREELPDRDSTAYPAELLAKAGARLHDVIRELRELTEGIDPPALTEQGLAAVVESLAERAPLPVQFEIPPGRWPVQVERTAYFVVNEALANVYKHAHASRAVVRVGVTEQVVAVTINDDGIGGADPDRGTGLRGLRDRVAVIGGTLELQSAPGAGTQIFVELPCA
jgi:signal transduction histidine kinase